MMKTYLLHFAGKGRVVELDPVQTSSEQYGEIQRSFLSDAGGDKPYDWPDMIDLFEDRKVGGLFYEDELVGASGASFRVIAMPGTTPGAIAAAKAKLRRDRDVVLLSVIRVKKLI